MDEGITQEPTPPNAGSSVALSIEAFSLAAIFMLLLTFTWNKWNDPVTDFGREMYVSWRISSGELPYRDFHYPYPSFSPAVNSLVFHAGSNSVAALSAVNGMLLFLFVVVSHLLMSRVVGSAAAFFLTVCFLVVFAFNHHAPYSNFSWMMPYHHGVLHGLYLSAVCLGGACLGILRGKWYYWAVAGGAFGLAMLTKLEPALALCVALAGLLAAAAWSHGWRSPGRGAAVMAASAAGTVALFGLAVFGAGDLVWGLSQSFRAHFAAVGETGPWKKFYLGNMGLLEPGWNVLHMLLECAAALVVLAPWERLFADTKRQRAAIAVRVIAAAAVGWYYLLKEAGQSLPLLLLILIVRRVLKLKRGRALDGEMAGMLALGCFALAFLAKMILMPRLFHYGSFLTAPACTYLFLELFLIAAKGGSATMRALCLLPALVLASLIAGRCVQYSIHHYSAKNEYLGGAELRTFESWIDPRSRPLQRTLDWLYWETPRHSTLAVLPEGAMLNVMSGRRNPTMLVTGMPLEWSLFGEAEIIANFEANPPDYVIILERSLTEYDLPPFGSRGSYGIEWRKWLFRNYTLKSSLREQSRNGRTFGVLVYARHDGAAP